MATSTTWSCWISSSEVAPIYSARGNGEDGSAGRPIAPDDGRLRYSWLLDLAGVRVGLTHDLPIPEHPPRLTVDRWKQRRFATTDVDVIVYGDSHVEGIDVVGPTLCVNPGSPTYPHNLLTQLGTLGFLEIEPGVVRASIWQLTDGRHREGLRARAGGADRAGRGALSQPAGARMSYDNIVVDRDGPVATITLNRPEKLEHAEPRPPQRPPRRAARAEPRRRRTRHPHPRRRPGVLSGLRPRADLVVVPARHRNDGQPWHRTGRPRRVFHRP